MSSFMGNTKLTLEIKNAQDESVKALTEKIPALSLIDSKTRMAINFCTWNIQRIKIQGMNCFNML